MNTPMPRPRYSGGTVFRPRAELPPPAESPDAPSMQSTWYISPEKLEQLRGAFAPRRQA